MPDDWDAPGVPLSIVHLLAPGDAGGLESVVRALATGQARQGHIVRMVAVLRAQGAPPSWLEPLAHEGVEVVPLVLPGRRYLRERAVVAALCRELGPDVVHSHGYRPDVVGAAGARKAGTPTVSTVHGFTGGGWKNRLYERLQLRALRAFDAVVAVAMPLAERLALAGVPRERLHVIPNAYGGGTTFATRADARRTLGVAEDVLHIGFVGRLGREKGADVLIDAVHRLAERNLVVSIVGDGRERRALERQAAALGLEGIIRFHGLMPDAARLLRAFDLLVLSSRTEGTPIVLLEGMAAGVPVVASRVGGVPDVVTSRDALLVPPEQPELLASAIASVLRAPKAAAARANRASARLADIAAMEPWLDRYEQLYREVLRLGGAAERIAV
ncbi:MAG TPA: glycosyltransferase [Gemmatimonadaceae bacterium]|nr:glycosyltransferase [Gemmatimonadaceae bacterium]